MRLKGKNAGARRDPFSLLKTPRNDAILRCDEEDFKHMQLVAHPNIGVPCLK